MNAMRILICATFAIIVAALAYTFVKQGNGRSLADIKQEIDEVKKAKLENNFLLPLGFNTDNTTPSLNALQAELAEPILTPDQIIAQANELEILKLAELELKNEIAKPAVDSNNSRAFIIKNSHVMAVVNYIDPTESIVILDLKRPENIVQGQILGIRRDNGVLGRLKLANKVEKNPSQAFADPVIPSFFGGKIDIRVGDELIIVP